MAPNGRGYDMHTGRIGRVWIDVANHGHFRPKSMATANDDDYDDDNIHEVLNASYAIVHINLKVVPNEEEGNGSGESCRLRKCEDSTTVVYFAIGLGNPWCRFHGDCSRLGFPSKDC